MNCADENDSKNIPLKLFVCAKKMIGGNGCFCTLDRVSMSFSET